MKIQNLTPGSAGETHQNAATMSRFQLCGITEEGLVQGRLVGRLRRPAARIEIDGDLVHNVTGQVASDAEDMNNDSFGAFAAEIPTRYQDDRKHEIVAVDDMGAVFGVINARIPRRASGKIAACDPAGVIQGVIEVTGLCAEHLTAALLVNGEQSIPFILGPKDLTRDAEKGTTRFAYRLRLPSRYRTGDPVALALVLEEATAPLVLDEKVFQTRTQIKGRRFTRSPVKRVVIVETSLTEARGHMMACIDVCVTMARSMGLEPIIIGNRKYEGGDISGVKVRPEFKRSLYDIASMPNIGQQLAKMETFKGAFKADLKSVLHKYESENTLFLYPTVNEYLICAIAEVLQVRNFSFAEQHLICLMLETGILRRGIDDVVVLDPVKVELFRDAFDRLAPLAGTEDADTRLPAHVHLAAISETHRANYQPLSAAPIENMPPMYGYSSRFETITPNEDIAPDQRQVLLYLGEAKEDKGFLLAPAVARRLLKERPDIRFVVQIHNARSPAAESAAKELRALSGKGLVVHEGFLDRSVYMGLLERSDAVVMAYNAQRYAGKTSGVLWEATSFDAPVVVPRKTWLEQEAALSGLSCETFAEHSAEAVGDALIRLLDQAPAGWVKAPKRDMFGQVHSYFNDLLSTSCADDMTFAGLFDAKTIQPRAKDMSEHGCLVREATIQANEPVAFVAGWGDPIATEYYRPGRWMATTALLRLDIDRVALAEVVISGETQALPDMGAHIRIMVDGVMMETAVFTARNARDFRLSLPVPARAPNAVAAPTWIEITIDPPEDAAEFDPEQALLVNAVAFGPLDPA